MLRILAALSRPARWAVSAAIALVVVGLVYAGQTQVAALALLVILFDMIIDIPVELKRQVQSVEQELQSELRRLETSRELMNAIESPGCR